MLSLTFKINKKKSWPHFYSVKHLISLFKFFQVLYFCGGLLAELKGYFNPCFVKHQITFRPIFPSKVEEVFLSDFSCFSTSSGNMLSADTGILKLFLPDDPMYLSNPFSLTAARTDLAMFFAWSLSYNNERLKQFDNHIKESLWYKMIVHQINCIKK